MTPTSESFYLKQDDEEMRLHEPPKKSEHPAEENYECILITKNDDHEYYEKQMAPPTECDRIEQEQEANLYKKTAFSSNISKVIERDDGYIEATTYHTIKLYDSMVDRFEHFFRDPTADYGRGLTDRMITALFIAQNHNSIEYDNVYNLIISNDEMKLAEGTKY